MIFPSPQKMRITEIYECGEKTLCVGGDESGFACEVLKKRGFSISEAAAVRVSLKRLNTRALCYIEESGEVSDEKFTLDAARCADSVEVNITFAHRHGLFYALCCLAQQLEGGELALGEIEDYPLFKTRGYIEGFYGAPWSAGEREDMLAFMAQKRMNTYYYAPKDDPYHRERWREPYPQKELEGLRRLVRLSEESFVRFNYCIAPGLSICYSSQEDYAALRDKLVGLYDIGVRAFGLLLDDIPEELYYEEDKIRFDYETVNAHIMLANRLFRELKALDNSITLTLCPLQYHGKGNEYFISKLGRGIDPQIRLFWTGRNICSQELTVPEAVMFIDSTRHRPLYWDNFPVNDAEMYNEMHLGYLSGRDKELFRYSDGLIANCMEFCECSKIPLTTVAHYLWNPLAYNEKESWQAAIEQVVGEGAEEFMYFADNLLASCLKTENSPLFNQIVSRAQQELYAGNRAEAFEILYEYQRGLSRCCAMLKADSRKLFKELRRWSKKQLAACALLENSLSIAQDNSEKKKKAVREQLDDYLRIPEVLADFSFVCLIERMLAL